MITRLSKVDPIFFFVVFDKRKRELTDLPLCFWQVCGVEALKDFSQHFLKPYKPLFIRGTLEEIEIRVSRLQEQLKEAESELERARKGKKPINSWGIKMLWYERTRVLFYLDVIFV